MPLIQKPYLAFSGRMHASLIIIFLFSIIILFLFWVLIFKRGDVLQGPEVQKEPCRDHDSVESQEVRHTNSMNGLHLDSYPSNADRNNLSTDQNITQIDENGDNMADDTTLAQGSVEGKVYLFGRLEQGVKIRAIREKPTLTNDQTVYDSLSNKEGYFVFERLDPVALHWLAVRGGIRQELLNRP